MALNIGQPEAFLPDQLLIENHADRDSRQVPRGHLPADPTIEQAFLAQNVGMIRNATVQHYRQ